MALTRTHIIIDVSPSCDDIDRLFMEVARVAGARASVVRSGAADDQGRIVPHTTPLLWRRASET